MIITDDNFMVYACKAYKSPAICQKDFETDLRLIGQIGRFITRIQNNHTMNLRVLINHVITFYNVFELETGTRLVLHRLSESSHILFFTLLDFLRIVPLSVKADFDFNIDEDFKVRLEECL